MKILAGMEDFYADWKKENEDAYGKLGFFSAIWLTIS